MNHPDVKMKPEANTRTGSCSLGKITTIEPLRTLFVDGANDLNWCFFGTSGVHGSFGALDDLFPEDYAGYRDPETGEVDPDLDHITVLVVQPRIVRMYYGHIPVRRGDLPFLREIARGTMAGVALSQEGSWPAGDSPLEAPWHEPARGSRVP